MKRHFALLAQIKGFLDLGVADHSLAHDGFEQALHGFTQFVQQLKGVVLVGAVVFGLSLVLWFIVKAIFGLRVSEEEEREGLDLGEHGNEAYTDFQPASHSH